MIALLVMTDGRDHVFETIDAAGDMLDGPITERWIHDDSGDPHRAEALRARYPGFRVISTAGRSGFGGAIRSAWHALRIASSAPYVFHLEDDFRFRRIVPLEAMVALLEHHPELVNIALRRQPWNADERAAGGIVEQHPTDYIDRTTWTPWRHGNYDEERIILWLEHRRFFTTNPGLYRRSLLLEHDWPVGTESEGHFSQRLLADPDIRFGYLGARDSGEWCEHVGAERVGIGY
jgi:hypothetical protein